MIQGITKVYRNFLVLVPFILIFLGGAFQNSAETLTTILKFLGFGFMIGYVVIRNSYNKNLTYFTLFFIPFLVYGILHSFNIKAGISDGLRYLFPIIVLFYSYAIREKFPLLLKFVVVFVTLNFLVQLSNYYGWLTNKNQWFYYQRDGFYYYSNVSGILRATGVVAFFGFFGFLNLISFLLIKTFYKGKYKTILIAISVFGIFASLSYKTVGTFILILFLLYYKRALQLILGMAVAVLGIILVFPEKSVIFLESFYLRINLYITGSESARSESYRVMLHEIQNFNLFGKGVGYFGGPASISYDSPYYRAVGFKWYDAEWLNLSTTDTFYPHPIVELGIIGGLMYLLLLCVPLLRKKITGRWLFIALIYFVLFFDALFSFSLNNPEFLMYSLVFVYPLFEYITNKSLSKYVKN